MPKNYRRRIFETLEIAAGGDRLSRVVDMAIMTLIFLNVVAVIFETVPLIGQRFHLFFKVFETFSVAFFTIEYLLRIWTCNEDARYSSAISGRIRFALTPLALIDLLAILPAYLPLFLPVDLRFLRVLRMFRILRLLKFARYSKAARLFGAVLQEKKEELVIALTAIFASSILIASFMYYLERAAQPDAFGSIPAAMWWSIISLTTVGYGDVYPITMLGKVFGGLIALLGIAVFALPAGIIASGFSQALDKQPRPADTTCPHCGKAIARP